MATDKERLTVYLDPKFIRQIKIMAVTTAVSVSELARRALEAEMARLEGASFLVSPRRGDGNAR